MYRKRAKNQSLSKNIIIDFSLSRVQELSKTNYNHWSGLHFEMNLLFTLYAHLYFVVYDERIHQRAASAHIETEHQRFSHDSFERLWLIIAFISSTEPRVIVYNAQHCKNAIEFSSWWRAALNVLITLVCILNIKTILFGHFFFLVFGKLHSKSTWLKNMRGHGWNRVPGGAVFRLGPPLA